MMMMAMVVVCWRWWSWFIAHVWCWYHSCMYLYTMLKYVHVNGSLPRIFGYTNWYLPCSRDGKTLCGGGGSGGVGPKIQYHPPPLYSLLMRVIHSIFSHFDFRHVYPALWKLYAQVQDGDRLLLYHYILSFMCERPLRGFSIRPCVCVWALAKTVCKSCWM